MKKEIKGADEMANHPIGPTPWPGIGSMDKIATLTGLVEMKKKNSQSAKAQANKSTLGA